jgi:hypothetical protein
VIAALALVVLFWGARMALGRSFEAMIVVAPLALLVPWTAPIAGSDSGVILPLAAAGVWVLWLSIERRGEAPFGKRGIAGWSAASFAAIVAANWAPQVVVLLAALVGYYFLGGRRALSARVAVAFLAAPLLYMALTVAVTPASQGYTWHFGRWFEDTIAYGWNMRPWFGTVADSAYRAARLTVNGLFYLPLLVPFIALSLEYRRCWWFAPTFTWGATLVLASIILGGSAHFLYSAEIQMGLVVPLGIAGVAKWREIGAKARGGQTRSMHGRPAAADVAGAE